MLKCRERRGSVGRNGEYREVCGSVGRYVEV